MQRQKCLLFLILYILVFSSWPTAQSGQADIELTILYTNDHHARLLPFDISGQKQVGGLAARKTLCDEIKAEVDGKAGYLLMLDGGDINTGEPISDMFTAEPDIRVMNLMQYQAMAMGNHEFDLSLDKMKKQRDLATFPFLSANVFDKETNTLLYQPFRIFDIHGMKVAVFALTPPETPDISTSGDNPKLHFVTPQEVLPQLLETLKSRADFIIGICHLIHPQVLELAKAFPDIDIILSSHSHLPIPKPIQVGKTLIAEAGCYGMMMARWDLAFTNRKLVNSKYQLLGINLSQPLADETGQIVCEPYAHKLAQAPEVDAIVTPYLQKADSLLKIPIGSTLADMSKGIRSNFPSSTALGNLIADAMRDVTKTDVAFHNIGGIRADLLKGTITSADIQRVLPFANTIVTCTMSGRQLQEFITQIAQRDTAAGGFFEVAGLTLRVKNKQVVQADVNGKAIDPDKKYKVATNSFIARGGDGYKIFTTIAGYETGFLLSQVVAEYIQKHSPVQPNPEIRMSWLREDDTKQNQSSK